MGEVWTRFGVNYADVPTPQTLTQGDGDTLSNDIALSEDEQYLVLAVTLAQYTALLSAALNGANRHYPEEYIAVIYPLIKAGKMSLCDALAECIETSPGFAEALQQWLADNGYGTGSGTPDTPTVYTNNPNILSGSFLSSCNNDNLYGGITQLVDLMNDTITDLLEKLEAATETAEVIKIILSAIPVTDILAVDEIIEFADQLVEAIGENYAAEYTQTLRDEICCDLFCATKDSCYLDFATWANYFMGKMGESITDISWAQAAQWFLDATLSGASVVYAPHALMCQVLAYGGEFFGVDMAWFAKCASSAMNDPDSDWETKCDCVCPAWNFTTWDGDWTNYGSAGAGTWTLGVGWSEASYGGNWLLNIHKTFTPVTITQMEYDLDVTWGSLGFAWQWAVRLVYDGTTVAGDIFNLAAGETPFTAGEHTRTITYSGQIDEIRIQIRTCSGTSECSANPGEAVFSEVRLTCPSE